jgi:hypothetical protein
MTRSATLHLRAKEVQFGHGHASAAFAREDLRHPCLDLLPGHARGQHGQRMAQIDHVVDARAKEVVGGGAGKHHGRTPRKQPLLNIKPGVPVIGIHPRCPVFMRVLGVTQGRQSSGVFIKVTRSGQSRVRRSGLPSTGHPAIHRSGLARGYLEEYARILDGEVLNTAASAMTTNPKALPWLE